MVVAGGLWDGTKSGTPDGQWGRKLAAEAVSTRLTESLSRHGGKVTNSVKLP